MAEFNLQLFRGLSHYERAKRRASSERVERETEVTEKAAGFADAAWPYSDPPTTGYEFRSALTHLASTLLERE